MALVYASDIAKDLYEELDFAANVAFVALSQEARDCVCDVPIRECRDALPHLLAIRKASIYRLGIWQVHFAHHPGAEPPCPRCSFIPDRENYPCDCEVELASPMIAEALTEYCVDSFIEDAACSPWPYEDFIESFLYDR